METMTLAAAHHREADALIRGMYTGQVPWSARERAYECKRRAIFATVRDDAGATLSLHRLLHGLPAPLRLNTLKPILPELGPQAGNTGLDALLHIACHHADWLREPEDWVPPAHVANDRAELLSDLLRHQFALYPPPRFLDAAWLLGLTDEAAAYRRWFMHLGQGEKLEAIRFPLPLTHRAAHFFLLAPDGFSIPAALRYGQIRALGGREQLAEAVSETRLSALQPDEAFWLTVVTFLINHPTIPLSQVGPLVDFVQGRRFGTNGDTRDAPEPTFTLKGRTPDSLLRRMDEWHESLARISRKPPQTWQPTGLQAFDREEHDTLSSAVCQWRISEICDTATLLEEGRAMRHCVYTYQEACLSGAKSIWSLRLTLSDSRTVRHLLTIEVNNARRAIVQVRGRCNQTLGQMRGNQRMGQAKGILREWARSERLSVACSL